MLVYRDSNRNKDNVLLTHLPLDNMATMSQTIFSHAFLNEKFCILITISLKFVLNGPIDMNTAFV